MPEPKHNEKKIAILVNPTSGKGKAVKISKWLAEQLT